MPGRAQSLPLRGRLADHYGRFAAGSGFRSTTQRGSPRAEAAVLRVEERAVSAVSPGPRGVGPSSDQSGPTSTTSLPRRPSPPPGSSPRRLRRRARTRLGTPKAGAPPARARRRGGAGPGAVLEDGLTSPNAQLLATAGGIPTSAPGFGPVARPARSLTLQYLAAAIFYTGTSSRPTRTGPRTSDHPPTAAPGHGAVRGLAGIRDELAGDPPPRRRRHSAQYRASRSVIWASRVGGQPGHAASAPTRVTSRGR